MDQGVIKSQLNRFVDVKPNEFFALVMACMYFYLLLCAYYIIRPIRNEMVIQNGVDNIQWLLLFAAIVMILITPCFGWITSRFKTQQFLSYCTLFFAANLLIFFFLFNSHSGAGQSIWVARGFYVWVNVFNMFIISLFWSFMNDTFNKEQSRRLFAFIGAGGTAGALTGPLITTLLVEKVGLGYLLLISAIILSLTVVCIYRLSHWSHVSINDVSSKSVANSNSHQNSHEKKPVLKGGVFDGVLLTWRSPYLLGICAFVVVFAVMSTFLSIQLAETIERLFDDSTQRTKLFSQADLATNVLTLLFQISITSKLIQWIGYRSTLMLLPIGLTFGFLLIGFAPILAVMIALSVFNRAGKYAVLNPTSEMLFTILSREEKYKAKNFIDTAVVRSSNVLSSWIYAGVKTLEAGGLGIAMLGAGLGTLWMGISYWISGQYLQRSGDVKKAAK